MSRASNAKEQGGKSKLDSINKQRKQQKKAAGALSFKKAHTYAS